MASNCIRCGNPALYVHEIGHKRAQFFCVKDLPNSLKKKASSLPKVSEWETIIANMEAVVEEVAPKKSSKKKTETIVEEPVVEETPVVEEPVVEEASSDADNS